MNYQEIAARIGYISGYIIATAVIAGLYYLFLVTLIGIPFTYSQILGALIIFNVVTDMFKKQPQE